MGEVYRATDTKLDREVAIKVLPGEWAQDRERLARFEREAKLLASLNHPNIAHVYGFESATLEDGSAAHFLAMELVEGEDLAERLKRGPIPVDEALAIATQIAEALEQAHEHGIVHRDLKPANVKITPDGRAKVLDFGLAKAYAGEASGSSSDLSQSPTLAHAGTQAGLLLGTAAYMSPEQARGRPVDRRSDIWAFGAVLYEMLTGKPLFAGETITDEPIQRLLRRCLTRDPRQRLQAIAEARIALEAPSHATTVVPGQVMHAVRGRSRRPLVWATLLASGLLLGYVVGRRSQGGAPSGSAEIHFERLSFGHGTIWAARFAPDGDTVLYSAAWDGNPIRTYLTRLDTPDSNPLSLPDAHLLSVSPTGELAVSLDHRFDGWMGEGTLARVPLLGGGARPLLEGVREADWAPDGSGLAVVRRVAGRERLEFPIGNVLYETGGWISHIRFSAKGDRIAYADHPIWSDDVGSVAVVDLRGQRKNLTEFSGDSVRGIAWSPSGDEVWFTTRKVTENVNAIRGVGMTGRQRTLFSGLARVVLYDVSRSGRVLLGDETTDRRVEARVAGSDEPRDFTLPRENTSGGLVSEDGRLVLVAETSGQTYSSYLWRTDGSPPVRLGEGYARALSPDARWVLCLTPEAEPRILLQPIGVGEPRVVPNPTAIQIDLADWTPDGKALVAFGSAPGERSRGWVLDPDGKTPPRAFTPEGVGITANASTLVISPDGSRVVGPDRKGGYASYPLAGGTAESIPGLAEPDLPLQWAADGKALFVARPGEPVWEVRRLDLATGAEAPWTTIAAGERAGLRLSALYLARNGRFWARSYARLLVDLYVAEGMH